MTETLEFKLVDAFALSPFSGNVAGVVLDADRLNEQQMIAIASEFNASETAFVLTPTTRDAAIRFRWFTPGCEVDFCGHATLAAAHALFESGRFSHAIAEPGTILPIETRSGILTIRTQSTEHGKQQYIIWLDMPHSEAKKETVALPPIARHLGLSPDMIEPQLPAIRTQDDDVILAVKTLPVLLELRPSMSELARYCARERIRGVMVTTMNTLSPSCVVQSRFFAPAVGIDEDPVTGSAHGPLGMHLVNCGIAPVIDGRADFHCSQAKAGGRAGLVRVVVTDAGDGRKDVRIGGTCVTTATGTLNALPERQ